MAANDPIKSRKKAGTNRTDSSLVDVYSQNVVIYALLQSTGLLKLREEFPLISRAEQGVLDPRDCYLAETSARPMWTTYDTVHAKPYVSRGRRGRPNELST
ncbi:hypothetical protein pdam_00007818 [Pocillopora damicornis]|uniref:Uncharacterized protein n=1 Tax=Pocillopora damicornis TaxID=46731 RepID=A0A3M6TXV7_POCDA|nr:hypothetical protein pdam_00007818 [Pocillopora damicornis]